MAQIDFKYATVYIEDGYVGPGPGAVNATGGYMAGVATMTVDTFVGSVATGDRFTVAADVGAVDVQYGTTPLTVHVITSHTETMTNTTSITFTPALVHAVVDNGAITILPHRLEVITGEGNLTWTEKVNIEYKKNRGLLRNVRYGDQEPTDVKMDFLWEFLSSESGDIPTIKEALTQTGGASTWVTAGADPCEPYATNIILIYIPPCSQEEIETIRLVEFRREELEHNVKDGTVAVSGKCNNFEAISTRG